MNYGRSVAVLKQAAIYRAAGMDDRNCALLTAGKYLPDDQAEIYDFILYHFATVERIARKIPLVVDGITRKEF